ncbi:xanthine dehydrogenase [Thermosipho melanesiensis]|uniref:Aldehyde oxidase and xanthine dehydrogenase, molybdopterin binding n=2 Tax=Thermosipho melanesiensis TaxID=46541 RepID=A6LNR8_THEM4|nr:xanthine dehydrogenase family protein molybdopterin-binding subunit [Thermosipho melanesiensis]ABR31569.1 aldehyde oxidase and xanthine dehydrogenase, molybdopterin binding [Thermosipho melanesiensis BI429]APT74602.1 xanthine dehydrogenase [Thermosipho melanesiensis]OOC35306.1 xanthine dehydrogenase [Thermosipho melanesiensis]OOC35525.1 xanthine dehydrogenase [Thermosipho melanesiensis]OOC36561.1 xanthine dehydrogenase [Thermosipho melanesiensis]
MNVFGNKVIRIDAKEKANGVSKYAADYYFPNMLYAEVVHANISHGILEDIDTEEAEKIPGVIKIATYKDVPGINKFGHVVEDMPFLVPIGEKVRFEGDAIALIAAESPEIAKIAKKLIKIKVKELPGVFSIEEAIEDKILIHDKSNIGFKRKIKRGNLEKAFNDADLTISKQFETGYQEHAYLETQGIVTNFSTNLELYVSAQCPFYVQKDVAKILNLDLKDINVIQTETGGGFGGKEDVPSYITAKAALLSYLTKRPVKLIYSREMDILETSKRHPSKSYYKVAFKKDGTILGVKSKIYLDMGAYSTLSPIVMYRTMVHACGAYSVDNVDVEVLGVYTNKVPCGAFRGFGSPQVLLAIESIMDLAAKKLNIDPYEIRVKNALEIGKKTSTGHLLKESVGAKKTLKKVYIASNYEKLKREIQEFNEKNLYKKRGLGWAHIFYGVSLGAGGQFLDGATAVVNIQSDGTITVMIGNTEMGQGAKTTIAIIISEILGQDVSKIRVLQPQTLFIQDSGPTVASRTTVFSGNAVKIAAEKLKENIISFLSSYLKVQKEEILFKDGYVYFKNKKFSFDEIAKLCNDNNVKLSETGWYKTPKLNFDHENGIGEAYITYSYATQLSMVEVDLLTGKIELKKVWVCHDIGKVINLEGAIGQVHGGIIQGMGYVLFEEIKQKNGKILTKNFNNYLIPTIKDIPNEFNVDFVEDEFSQGPFGAKGLGEPSLMSAPPSIFNAVSNAIKKALNKIPISIKDIITEKE